jgi:hypothetical protein
MAFEQLWVVWFQLLFIYLCIYLFKYLFLPFSVFGFYVSLYREVKKSLCTWWLQYHRQGHRDFSITLYNCIPGSRWRTCVMCFAPVFVYRCAMASTGILTFGTQMYFPKRTKLIKWRTVKCKCFHISFQYGSQDVCLRWMVWVPSFISSPVIPQPISVSLHH